MNDDAFQTIAMQMAPNASVGTRQPLQRLDADARPAQSLTTPVLILEEPAEDQAGEHQRQRPWQQQAEAHRPLDA